MIRQIKIRGFLQQFDYDLDFSESRIKFITGPNGYGKTTILNLIDYLFHEQWKELCSVVFKNFEVILSDGVFRIEKKTEANNSEDDDGGSDEIEIRSSVSVFLDNKLCVVATCLFDENGKVIGKIKVEKKDAYKKSFKLFINNQKLLSIKDSRLYKSPKALKDNFLVIEENSDNLHTQLIEKRNDVRIILSMNKTASTSSNDSISDEKIDFWKKLKKYGLIDKEEPTCDSGTLDILIDKLKTFVTKLELFDAIIEKCEFTNKKMEINPEFGYIFRLNDEYQSILDFSQLSSGEKQILTILYALLFDIEEDSIVLIDEPEISFHMSWQVMFLSVLKKICKSKPVQYIIATHSPQMFDLNFDNAIDLFEISEKE